MTQTRNNTKKRKQRRDPVTNKQGRILTKQTEVVQRAENQPDRMSTREEATLRAQLAT